MATLHTQKSNQTLSTTGTRLQKATVISDLQLAAGKLKFIYDMWVAKFDRDEVLTGIIYSQDREFWYLETAKLTKEHTTSVNEDFARG
jgi:antibiotic biosynthesis monooxygenase (ABM) superfamily enzyme